MEEMPIEDVDESLPLVKEVNVDEVILSLLTDLGKRLDALEVTQNGIKNGVNTIGEMMNQVASVFDGLAEKVKQGGIGALLGGMMGGKKIDG